VNPTSFISSLCLSLPSFRQRQRQREPNPNQLGPREQKKLAGTTSTLAAAATLEDLDTSTMTAAELKKHKEKLKKKAKKKAAKARKAEEGKLATENTTTNTASPPPTHPAEPPSPLLSNAAINARFRDEVDPDFDFSQLGKDQIKSVNEEMYSHPSNAHCSDLHACWTTDGHAFTANCKERVEADALLSTLIPTFKDKLLGHDKCRKLLSLDKPICEIMYVHNKMSLRTRLCYPCVARERAEMLAKYRAFASLGTKRSPLDEAQSFKDQAKESLDAGRSGEAIGYYEAAALLFLLGGEVAYPNLEAAKCIGNLSLVWKNLAPPERLCSEYVWEAYRAAHLCMFYCPEYTTGLTRMIKVLEKLVELGADHYLPELKAYCDYKKTVVKAVDDLKDKSGGVAMPLFWTGLIDQSDFSRRQQARKLKTLERIRQSGSKAGIACSLVAFNPNTPGLGDNCAGRHKTPRPTESGQWLAIALTFIHNRREEIVPAVEFAKVDSVRGNELTTKRLATARSLAASKLYIESFVAFVAASGLFTGGLVLSQGLGDAVKSGRNFRLRGDLLRRMNEPLELLPNFNVRLRGPGQRWSAHSGMTSVAYCTTEDENRASVGCDVPVAKHGSETCCARDETLLEMITMCESSNFEDMVQGYVKKCEAGFDINKRIPDFVNGDEMRCVCECLVGGGVGDNKRWCRHKHNCRTTATAATTTTIIITATTTSSSTATSPSLQPHHPLAYFQSSLARRKNLVGCGLQRGQPSRRQRNDWSRSEPPSGLPFPSHALYIYSSMMFAFFLFF
jgi:hypothetical protein